MNEYGTLARIVLKHARDAFVDQARADGQWRDLRFTAAPDVAQACREYDAFAEAIATTGTALDFLPAAAETTLDSIYVRDASLTSSRGMILCSMGKPQRTTEPRAQEAAFTALGIPIAGRITAPGRIEGGDVVWMDSHTLVVGRGYRTNDEGIRQLQAILGPDVGITVVPLPHWSGEQDVMHLMSLISPVDADLAVVYSRLLPVPFREWLLQRGVGLVEVPDEEFESMGTNVLAVAPRRCVMLRGNPRTRQALERAGAEVVEYDGTEISRRGAGGPTCLTRPITRAGAGTLSR
ncbi:MAG TPA: arginine deiminase family protein [Vicinamibacterales bacterium]|nr:arginine deiminase family protein [Vicinamibacterales bacterium]